jgi:hypothetical protein
MKPVYNHPKFKLGKRAPRLDPRTFKLSKYLPKAIPPAPIADGYLTKVGTWPMYLNDTLGDCAIASAAHIIQQEVIYAGTGTPITNADVLLGYEKVGNYVPGEPTTDNGCDLLTALNYWRSTGYGGHKIAAYVSVDYTNPLEVQQAIAIFGSVYLGVQLPLSAQNPTQTGANPCWSVPSTGLAGDGSPGGWGGHAIPALGFSADPKGYPGLEVISWGQVYDMTWNFLAAYGDEAYAVASPDWVEKNGRSPSGFLWNDLLADLEAL